MTSSFTVQYNQIVEDSNRCFNSGLTVKKHQVEGAEWCVDKELAGLPGAFISDEMGLGKTVIMLMTCLISRKTSTLIVLPSSILQQWSDQILKIAGHKCLIYYGQKKKKITTDMLLSNPIVITTYGTISILKKNKYLPSSNLLHHVFWDRVIYDEAHHLRNKNANWHGASLIKSNFSWFITGTPIQNRMTDFKNMCSIGAIAIANAPILRRTKSEVGISLKPPILHDITVKWSSAEESLARNIHFALRFATNMTDSIVAMQLCKQSCIYPKLLQHNSHHISRITGQELNNDQYLGLETSKISAVVNTLHSRSGNNNGKLVFCHYRSEMNELSRQLKLKNMSVTLIQPSHTPRQRTALLTASCIPENHYIEGLPSDLMPVINSYLATDVTIVQIKSCSEGLNLQQNYSEVYFVGPAWNPSVEAQAIARCHRIGQKKQVEVFRFYMEAFVQEGFPITHDSQGKAIEYYNLDQYIRRTQNRKTLMSNNFFTSATNLNK